jgi:hypothetical protein
MQTLQNQKIEEMSADRRSENRLDGLTVKSSDDGKQVNRGHHGCKALLGPLPFHADPAEQCFSAVDCESALECVAG